MSANHTLTALVLGCSSHVEARFFAAAVPAANILRLGLLGLGITKNEAVVKAVSREGNPRSAPACKSLSLSTMRVQSMSQCAVLFPSLRDSWLHEMLAYVLLSGLVRLLVSICVSAGSC